MVYAQNEHHVKFKKFFALPYDEAFVAPIIIFELIRTALFTELVDNSFVKVLNGS